MLSLKNINKSFSGVQVLFDISAEIENKKVTAIIGENGAGKSTLMNIISGSITDHTGTIFLHGKELRLNSTRDALENGITIIHQELNILPDLTAGENIFLGREPVKKGLIDYRRLYYEADEILKQFRFPWSSELKMRSLSVGWQQIVEIARALSLDAEVIIMDEPTSALSGNETEILFEKIQFLRDQGKTILFISHRISEVLEIADNIIVLRDGRSAAELKASQTNRNELIGYMAGVKQLNDTSFFSSISEEEVLRLENVFVNDNSLPLKSINFALNKGEILGVAGLLGSGRTELLKFIFGESRSRYSGEILFKGREYIPESSTESISKGIVYLPENRKEEGIFPDHSLLFNAGISVLDQFKQGGLLNNSKEEELITGKFSELKVKLNSTDQKIKTLSGGNQQKVLLSRILLTEPEVILLDDPTRGIDIASKEEIYELMRRISQRGISIIFTSSEIPELLKICARILVLSNGTQTALLNSENLTSQDILNFAFKNL